MLQYKDGYVDHDHTYFGNGCPNAWGQDGAGGSTTACSSRVMPTNDSNPEMLSVGTYYTFHASTSGSGMTATTDNGIISDSFCPLGWQLPYAGTGGDYYDKSKSWKMLFSIYSYTSDTGTKKYPLSYIDTGIYHWTHGKLYSMYVGGFMTYWSNTTKDRTSAYRLDHANPSLQSPNKTNGHSLRCV